MKTKKKLNFKKKFRNLKANKAIISQHSNKILPKTHSISQNDSKAIGIVERSHSKAFSPLCRQGHWWCLQQALQNLQNSLSLSDY